MPPEPPAPGNESKPPIGGGGGGGGFGPGKKERMSAFEPLPFEPLPFEPFAPSPFESLPGLTSVFVFAGQPEPLGLHQGSSPLGFQ